MTITVSFCFSPSKLVKLSSCLSVIVACLDPGVVLVSGRERNTVSFPYSLQQKVKQKKKHASHHRCRSTFRDGMQTRCASITISSGTIRIMNRNLKGTIESPQFGCYLQKESIQFTAQGERKLCHNSDA